MFSKRIKLVSMDPKIEKTYADRMPDLAEKIVKKLSVLKKTIAAAESCTAGLASDFIARIPGASNVFWGSFVTYTVDAKIKMLGVPGKLIKEYGAVSRPVALAMAEGTLDKSGASWAFSVTGFAGPGGDSAVPTGTVWIGVAGHDGVSEALRSEAKMYLFSGSRNEVREAAATAALQELLERINGTGSPGIHDARAEDPSTETLREAIDRR